jgi:DNA-binding transcriptional regulator LsrR (DeoR family)
LKRKFNSDESEWEYGKREESMMASRETLVRMAWQYYIEGLTQQEIATRYKLSRSKVARLLGEAREVGIVEFRIRGMPTENLELESNLCRRFDLKDVIVIPARPERVELRRELGRAAASVLERLIRQDTRVGLGMGRTISQIPQFIHPGSDFQCSFVEMVGGSSRTDKGYDTYNVSWRFAELYNGVAYHVNSPVVVGGSEIRRSLLSDPNITGVLELAKGCDMAVIGIGEVSADMTLARLGYCNESTMQTLRDQGAVGDILGHFIDTQGRLVDNAFERRLIGLSLDELRKIPAVLAVAGGEDKHLAVLGALRGGYLSHLVTDSSLAQKVLEIEKVAIVAEKGA